MFLQILNLILPIAAALALGMAGRKRGWFGDEGINAFKNIVSKVMLLLFLLPPSFAVPMFSRLEGSEEYIATTISFSTVVTLLIFIVIAVFAFA